MPVLNDILIILSEWPIKIEYKFQQKTFDSFEDAINYLKKEEMK